MPKDFYIWHRSFLYFDKPSMSWHKGETLLEHVPGRWLLCVTRVFELVPYRTKDGEMFESSYHSSQWKLISNCVVIVLFNKGVGQPFCGLWRPKWDQYRKSHCITPLAVICNFYFERQFIFRTDTMSSSYYLTHWTWKSMLSNSVSVFEFQIIARFSVFPCFLFFFFGPPVSNCTGFVTISGLFQLMTSLLGKNRKCNFRIVWS